MLLLKRFFTVFFIFSSVYGFAQTQRYYILFSARFTSLRPFSFTGHAFITWRSEDTLFQKVEQLTYGFFPKKSGGVFNNTEGDVVEGYVKNSLRERLVRRFIIEVDSAIYDESLEKASTWKHKTYNLFNNNCVHFMDDIAQKLNLKTTKVKIWYLFPRRPSVYVRKLKKLNHERIVKNKALERVRLRILHKAQVDVEEDEDEKQK